MNQIVIDQINAAKLQNIGDQCAEIRDESGRLLGYFSPVVDRSIYEGVESPISSEEMDRAYQARRRATAKGYPRRSWNGGRHEIYRPLASSSGSVSRRIWHDNPEQRSLITACASEIDKLLAENAFGAGESRSENVRILLAFRSECLFIVHSMIAPHRLPLHGTTESAMGTKNHLDRRARRTQRCNQIGTNRSSHRRA